MKKILLMILVVFCVGMCLYSGDKIFAMEEETREVNIYNGDVADTDDDSWWSDNHDVGETGIVVIRYFADDLVTKTYESSDDSIVSVDTEGNYHVHAGGKAVVTARGYDEEGELCFEGSYCFFVKPSLAEATLAKTKTTAYILDWTPIAAEIAIVGVSDLTYTSISVSDDNDSMYVSCTLDKERNVLVISSYSEGKANVTVTINDTAFTFQLVAKKLDINKRSAVVAKGKTLKLKLKGYSGDVTWTSTNKKIAKVNAKGEVKAKKIGNAVVYLKFKDKTIGCAVSVVSTKMKKVVNKAIQIGSKWKYDQSRRMQKGYYDCSSLVWKAYKLAGKSFGSKSYAPVAADEGKWCIEKKKKIKGGLSYKNIQNMKLRPGDLLFKTGANNGRYKGIYHVEMFVGYYCYSMNGDVPTLGIVWATPTGGSFSGFMARP